MKTHIICATSKRAAFLAAFAVAAACFSVHAGLKERYLDLMEKAVSAYSHEHIRTYLESVEDKGLAEHGFPRLTANIGILLAKGRHPVGADLFPRMMDACCGQMATAKARNGSRVGNDFSVKEIVLCLLEVERAGLYPKARTDAWRAGIARMVPKTTYTAISVPGENRARNWSVFAAASEQSRVMSGLGGDPSFVESQIANQMHFFDANGMYKDPGQPMVYDAVTRLQFALAIHLGYDGPSRAALEALLLKSAEPTLKMQSVTGEIPFGGRSNQFLHNETFWCALCEYYAAWFSRHGDRETARRFRVAARRAADSMDAWLSSTPVRHVKNRFPLQSHYGCESYAYFDKYMVTMGSWAYIAYRFCDESVPDAEKAGDSAPSAFVTGPDFHRVMLNAGGYTAQFDLDAQAIYDASGLGRVHRKGAPSAICLSVPVSNSPHYVLDVTNATPFAILPGFRSADGTQWLYDGKYVCKAASADANAAHAELSVNGKGGCTLDWRTDVSADGVLLSLVGVPEPALTLPAFLFDGERKAEHRIDGGVLEVRYGGWTCRYETNGTITDSGLVYGNRNGHYRRYEVVGKGTLKVRIVIFESSSRR